MIKIKSKNKSINSNKVIEVINLKKKYKGKTVALNDINFSINKGEIVGILGPNGAGKTTLLNILSGCLSFDCGEVFLNGHDIIKEPYISKSGLGYLPEVPPLYPKMTIYEYLDYICGLKKVKDKKSEISKVSALAKLGSNLNVLIDSLSKGYKQRVGIAQALIANPSLIILDEPTSGLDPGQIVEIRELIRSLASNHTIVLSTQILFEIHSLCDRIIILCGGDIIANGTQEQIANEVSNDKKYYLSALSSYDNISSALSPLDDKINITFNKSDDKKCLFEITTSKNYDLKDDIAKLFLKNGICVTEFYEKKMSLEDAFLNLTYKKADEILKNINSNPNDDALIKKIFKRRQK